MAGPQGLNRVSLYGTAVGIDAPPAGRTFEIKPYAFGRSTTDRLRTPAVSNDLDLQLGGDVKYGITANLTADFTYNTDFAQVEVDEQQVNLTRFSLFFPEKRDFFLEGRGIFDFGRGGASSGGGIGGASSPSTPFLFYSRRIGLNRGRVVPIEVGGRVTGKVGKYGVGLVEHPGRRRRPLLGHAGHQLHRGAREARHPAEEHHRRDVHRPLELERRAGASTTWPTASTRAFGFFENLTIGGYWAQHARPTGAARATTTATRAASTTLPIATACASST